MTEPRLADRRANPFADRSRRGSDPIVRTRLNEPKVTTLRATAAPSLGDVPDQLADGVAREPELGFLRSKQLGAPTPVESGVIKDRTDQNRTDMSALLTANDKRGALAANDLRQSLLNDRALINGAPVNDSAGESLEVTAREPEAPLEPAIQPREATPARTQASSRPPANSQHVNRQPEGHQIDRVERAVEGDPNTLHIGAAIRVEDGRITNCGTMVVEGRMEAELDGGRLLEVTENGAYIGSAKVECAQIDGQFDGELTVTGRLMISATGRVSGKIRYARIEVEPGGVILGDLGSLPQR